MLWIIFTLIIFQNFQDINLVNICNYSFNKGVEYEFIDQLNLITLIVIKGGKIIPFKGMIF